jgi:hypothetical protein
MKKSLLFALMMIQSIVLQGATFKYLGQLPQESKVKQIGDSLQRAWFFKDETEKACDFLDNEIDFLVVKTQKTIQSVQNEKDWLERAVIIARVSRDTVAKLADPSYLDQINKTIKVIIPEVTSNDLKEEVAFIVTLLGNCLDKELAVLRR